MELSKKKREMQNRETDSDKKNEDIKEFIEKIKDIEAFLPKERFFERFVRKLYLKNKDNRIIRYFNGKTFKFKSSFGDLPVKWGVPDAVNVFSVGQSHLDAAWLWRKNDTLRKKVPVTFSRALFHIELYKDEEKYPFYFTQNQVVYYDWVKKYYPQIWERIKEKIKEGRWEFVDGAWVESDVNIPNGESLIRQRLMGQYFYLEEFGRMSDIAWADDVFGFTAQLPQILYKCNARYFLTNKFCYNDTNKFPYHTFIWKGLDGSSEILCAWNQHKNNWHKYLKTFRELSVQLKDGNGQVEQDRIILNYMSDFNEVIKYFDAKFFPYTINVYGQGDGGNGPTPLEIIEQLCWDADGFVKAGKMSEFFGILEDYRDKLPIWYDELYLENHRGTLTSIHMIKENNKTAEVLLHDIEFLNVINTLNGGKNFQYEISELWKKVLFCQFHDVLPGSSIIEVYRDCAKDYESVFKRIYEIRGEIGLFLLNKLRTQKARIPDKNGSKMNMNAENVENTENMKDMENVATVDDNKINNENYYSIIIGNSFSWERDGIISVPISKLLNYCDDMQTEYSFNVIDDDDKEYPTQVMDIPFYDANREFSLGFSGVTGENYMAKENLIGQGKLEKYIHPEWISKYLWILIPKDKSIPPFSFRHLQISAEKLPNNLGIQKINKYYVKDYSNEIILENNLLIAKINKKTAGVIELKFKTENDMDSNIIKMPANVNLINFIGLALYEDFPTKFDAWNIYPEYYKHPIKMPEMDYFIINNHESVIHSVLFISKKSASGSIFTIRIYLVEDDPTIYFDIAADWQEDHKLLKFKVDPKIKTEEVYCGIQYGYIKRVTVPKNRFNDYRAKPEYSNQQWASISGTLEENIDNNNGTLVFTLINRNKYGLFTHGSIMELSLLKAAKFEKYTNAATLDDDIDPNANKDRSDFHRPQLIDRGFHRISTGINIKVIPAQDSDFQRNDINWQKGFEFNYPFISLDDQIFAIEGQLLPSLNKNHFDKFLNIFRVENIKGLEDVIIGNIKLSEHYPPHPSSPEYTFPSDLTHIYDLRKDSNKFWVIVRAAKYTHNELKSPATNKNKEESKGIGVIDNSIKNSIFKVLISEQYKLQKCLETDMLERVLYKNRNGNHEDIKEIQINENENSVKIKLKPGEIKTIALLINGANRNSG
ncbi:MAG: glycoside hydrolase family 38 C-terminal domain-containing protein [Promethearchaeota archaeon]